MVLLVDLGLLERLIAGLEIGAGILAVAVEEEVVELVVEVVVMRDVALRPADRIVLLEDPHQALPAVGPAYERRAFQCGHVAAQQIKQVVDVAAAFDGEQALHVGFAKRQARSKGQPDAGPPSVDAHRDSRALADSFDLMRSAGRIDNGQLAFPQNSGKDRG